MSTTGADTRKLADLARKLHLTEKQRKFAEAFVETSNASAAARAAGYSNENTAKVMAHRMVRNKRVMAYLAEFKKTVGDVLAVRVGAAATKSARALEIMHGVAEGEIPWKATKNTLLGMVIEEEYSQGQGAAALLRYYGDQAKPGSAPTNVIVQVLQQSPESRTLRRQAALEALAATD